MQSRATRLLSLFLAMLFCMMSALLCLPLEVSADSDTGTRFVFDELLTDGGAYTAGDTPLQLSLVGNPTFHAVNFSPVTVSGKTNALYLAFVNRSPATRLSVTYEYINVNHTPQRDTVTLDILPQSETLQTLYFDLPYIDSATAVSFSLGVGAGTLELRSMFNVSMHNTAQAQTVTVDKCWYVPESHTIEMSGSLLWETQVLYSGSTLALFALAPDEEIYLSNKMPVSRVGIASDFSFSVPVQGATDLFYRYVIAVITASGERVPLTTPYYPVVTENAPGISWAFKGDATGDYEHAITAGADSAILEVYLDRLLGDQNGGILYAGDHSYYYFDQAYVSELDAAIRNLTGAGCRVYLRLLISPNANDLPFTTYTEPGEVLFGKGVYIRNEEALLTVYAMTDFLTLRYADDAVGRIGGLILGQTVNHAALYNRTEAKSLAEDAALYAAAYSLVSGVACRNIPGLSMILPLSDQCLGETLDGEELGGAYPADLYLRSFLDALKDFYITPPAVNLLVETDAIPGESLSEDRYDTEHWGDLTGLLQELGTKHGNLSGGIGYVWFPDATLKADALQSIYTRLFIDLKLKGNVYGFFVSTSRLDARRAAEMKNTLKYVFTYLDTDRHASVVAPMIAYYGISSVNALFPAYDPSVFRKRSYHRLTLTEGGYADVTPIGKYVMWNFASATDTLDWYAGYGCSELSVLSENEGTVLLGKLNAKDFAGVAHRFDGAYFKAAPLLRFEMGIDGEKGAQYELQVQLISGTSTVLASAVLTAGTTGDFCLDLSQLASGLSDVSCIRICARPLTDTAQAVSLRVGSITLESAQYNDEQLREQIAASAALPEDEPEDEGLRKYTTPIIVTALVLLSSVIIAVMLIVRGKNRKNSKENEEK